MSWRELQRAHPSVDSEALAEEALSGQLAVALRYDGHDRAPRLVAKGRGEVARAMVQVAEAHDVPVTEDPDLAALLERLQLQQEIPPELYQVIAEILVFVHAANARYGGQGQPRGSQ